MTSLYIHIPFCKRKCLYCDFLSFPDTKYINEYFDALIKEINAFDCKKVRSIFIGGGTPSYVDSKYIGNVMEALSQYDLNENAEITIEANPGTLTLEKLKAYRSYGINRISIGLQAWQNELLKKLGRIHTKEEFLENYENILKAGFHNINIDLMFSLPNQSYDMWLETLENAAALDPTHISAYSLIVEENTPFYDMDLALPDEITDRKMYHTAINFLNSKGYKQYEISNFAKEGFHSVHNCVYWQRKEYKGFGLGAASLINNCRLKNTENINDYIKGMTIIENEKLTRTDSMAEYMFLGMRMTKGVSISGFKKEFNEDMLVKYKDVFEKYKDFIAINGDQVRLNEKGIDISNMIFCEFL